MNAHHTGMNRNADTAPHSRYSNGVENCVSALQLIKSHVCTGLLDRKEEDRHVHAASADRQAKRQESNQKPRTCRLSMGSPSFLTICMHSAAWSF